MDLFSLWDNVKNMYAKQKAAPQGMGQQPSAVPNFVPITQAEKPRSTQTPKISGVNALIQQDQNSPALGTVDEPVDTAEPQEQKKEGVLGKILPLLFRFALPTAAGAALGGGNPFMSAATGGLVGLSGGGLGYLNEKNQDKKNALAQEKLDAMMQNYNTNANLKEMSLDDLAKYRDEMAKIAQQNADANTLRASQAGEKSAVSKNKDDAVLTFLAKQFKGQTVSDAQRDEFTASLSTQIKPKDLQGDPGTIAKIKNFFSGDNVDPAVVKRYMDAYNQFIQRGGNAGTPSTFTSKSGIPYSMSQQ